MVAVVAGQTQAGKQASLSHTAGLATDARVVRGLLDQAGVVPARDFTELIELTHALSVAGAPRSAQRVAVVSTSGAACVLCADLLSEAGLSVATLGRRRAYRDSLRCFPTQTACATPSMSPWHL